MAAVATAIPAGLSVVQGVSRLFGGPDKNAERDQQEASRYQSAVGGDVSAAQGIYHDSLPQNKQTAERIKDDQMYWQRLQSAGWTVDGSGTVKPPSTLARIGNALTLGGGGGVGNYTIAGSAPVPNPALTISGQQGSVLSVLTSPTGELFLFGGVLLVTVLIVAAIRR